MTNMKRNTKKSQNSKEKDLDTIKYNLWYSAQRAERGEIFHVPCQETNEVTRCTAITMDQTPPTESSEFISIAYLKG